MVASSALCLTVAVTLLLTATITFSPLVRYIQMPGYDGAPFVFGTNGGPRAPIPAIGVAFVATVAFAALIFIASIVHRVHYDAAALDWYDAFLEDRRSRQLARNNPPQRRSGIHHEARRLNTDGFRR